MSALPRGGEENYVLGKSHGDGQVNPDPEMVKRVVEGNFSTACSVNQLMLVRDHQISLVEWIQ